MINRITDKLQCSFDLKDLGPVECYLGVQITRDNDGSFLINQERYIRKIVEEAGLVDAKLSRFPLDVGYYKINDNQVLQSNDQYRKLIGMLLYLCTNSRPDISAAISILSQKVSMPTKTDLNELKRVIRYIKGTSGLRLKLSTKSLENQLYAYNDANWGEDKLDRK